LSLVILTEGVVRAILGIASILLGYGIGGTLAMYMLSAALVVFALPRPSRFWTGARAASHAFWPLYRDAGQLLFANLCLALLVNLDVIISRRYLSPSVADYYVAIAAMAKFFLFVMSSVSLIAFAETIRSSQRGESTVRSTVVTFGLIGVLGVPFTLLCALAGPLIMAIAFGPAYRASGNVLWITAFSAGVMSVIYLEIAYFNAQSWLWYLPVLVLGGAGIVVALQLSDHSLKGYAGIFACGSAVIALTLSIPMMISMFTPRLSKAAIGPG
jgi:O-antigen/teichoic acid export membrane protein